MITVGLIKELYFIAKVLNQDLSVGLNLHPQNLDEIKMVVVRINPSGLMKVHYNLEHIWTEQVEGDASFFGVESCDSISRIIACMNNGTDWKHLAYHEKS